MSVDFDVSEVMELAVELAGAGPKAEKLSSARLTEVAAQMRDDYRNGVAVDTGELRGSIYVRGSRDVRYVGSDARHAFFHEFGTSDTAPNPALWPAASKAERALFEELRELGNPFD